MTYFVGKNYKDKITISTKLYRFAWRVYWKTLLRWIPGKLGSSLYVFSVNIWGGNCAKSATIYSSAELYDPRNLFLGANSTLGPNSFIYNVGFVAINKNVTISQSAKLITASHRVDHSDFELITGNIIIGDDSWIGMGAIIGLNVEIKRGSIVGMFALQTKSTGIKEIWGGNPSKLIKKREISL